MQLYSSSTVATFRISFKALLIIVLWTAMHDTSTWADQQPSQLSPSVFTTEAANPPQNSTSQGSTTDQSKRQGDIGLSIPPQILQNILQSAQQPTPQPMPTRKRLGLVLAGAIAVILGVIICQILAARLIMEGQDMSIFLIFGLFSAIGALCLACGLVGSLRLHLFAVICIMLSGFCIGAIGLGPAQWFRGFLLKNTSKRSIDRKNMRL